MTAAEERDPTRWAWILRALNENGRAVRLSYLEYLDVVTGPRDRRLAQLREAGLVVVQQEVDTGEIMVRRG